jgi:serine/threonine protein kinase
MPPEQGMGLDIDRRSDVYAAGVVLWETLTGRRLFKAEHDGQLIAMVLQGTDKSPRELVPVIPESVDRVCMTALALAPENRYPTAAAFADALESAAQEADVRVPTGRQLAAFVHQYKIKLKSLPPPSLEDIEAATSPSKVQSEVTASVLQTAPDPIADPPSAASVPTGTSLTGIGAVRSQRPGEVGAQRNPKVLLGAAVAALAVAVLGGVALFGGSETDPAAGAGEPTVAAAIEPPAEPSVKASAEPTSSTKTAAATPTASAKPVESAKPTETSAATTKKPTSGKPRKRWKRKGQRGPLGFEPDDL